METIKRERKGLSNKTKKQLSIATIVLCCLLLVFTTFEFVYPVKAFLLGVFGFMLYPILLLVILFCIAILMNKKFVYSIKYLVYLFLSYFFFVCVLHICVTGFTGGENLGYGGYLLSCYKSVYTPGGLLVGVFTYPVTSLLHSVAGIVVYAILFIISLYFIISYLDGIKQGKITQPQPKNYTNFNRIANDLQELEIKDKEYEEPVIQEPITVLKQEEEKTLKKINYEDDNDIFIKDENSENVESEEEINNAKVKLGLISKSKKEDEEEEETPKSKLFTTRDDEEIWKSRGINKEEEKPRKFVYDEAYKPKPKQKTIDPENVNYLRTLYEPNLNPNNPIINAETDDYKSLLKIYNQNSARPFERDFSLNANQLLVANNKISSPQQNPQINSLNQNNITRNNGENNFNIEPNQNGNYANFNPQNRFNNLGNNSTLNNAYNNQNNQYQNLNNAQNNLNAPNFNASGNNLYNNANNSNGNFGANLNASNSSFGVNNSSNYSANNSNNFSQISGNATNNNNVNNPTFNSANNGFNIGNSNNANANKEPNNVPNFSINIEGLEDDFIKPINEPQPTPKVSPLNPVNFDLSQEKFAKPEEDKTPKFLQKESVAEPPFKTSNLSEGDIATSLGNTYNLPKSLMPQTPIVNGVSVSGQAEPEKDTGPDFRYNSKYIRPPIDLLKTYVNSEDLSTNHERNIEVLERSLEEFGIPAKVEAVRRGASVTRYELHMPAGVSVKKIHAHASDIALALAAKGEVRIETPIKGKSAVGIEVPNAKIDTVGLKDIIASQEFAASKAALNFALGQNVDGEVRCCNLAKMPHLLVAGSTGSGKSVCLNTLLLSLLYKTSPQDLRLILVDPKKVEFGIYNNLPHLLMPKVITEPKKALNAMDWLINEMERRYTIFQDCYVKDISEYNAQPEVASKKMQKLPYVVLVVDELADLVVTTNKKELEEKIIRLTQKARAAGIHVILATQRPSVDIITGSIKINLPARIAFKVTNFVDSKTILDQGGAERLLGRGDMLFSPPDGEAVRIQGAFVDTPEVKSVVDFIKENNKATYDDRIERIINSENGGGGNGNPATVGASSGEEFDSIMPDALKMVIENGQASISMLQRRFSIGFSRAARIIDQMEQAKFISSSDGSKPRSVFITMDDYNQIYGNK